MLSYLPLAHMYERMMECHMYTMGVKVGFFSGNIRKIIEDMKELKPTIVPLVPRMLTRIYEKVICVFLLFFPQKIAPHFEIVCQDL